MPDSKMTTRSTPAEGAPRCLQMHWLPVTDASGRTRMVATWIEAGAASAAPAHHAA